MTKKEFQALALRFGVSAHYSGKTRTMHLRGHLIAEARFVKEIMTEGYRVWNFAVV